MIPGEGMLNGKLPKGGNCSPFSLPHTPDSGLPEQMKQTRCQHVPFVRSHSETDRK